MALRNDGSIAVSGMGLDSTGQPSQVPAVAVLDPDGFDAVVWRLHPDLSTTWVRQIGTAGRDETLAVMAHGFDVRAVVALQGALPGHSFSDPCGSLYWFDRDFAVMDFTSGGPPTVARWLPGRSAVSGSTLAGSGPDENIVINKAKLTPSGETVLGGGVSGSCASLNFTPLVVGLNPDSGATWARTWGYLSVNMGLSRLDLVGDALYASVTGSGPISDFGTFPEKGGLMRLIPGPAPAAPSTVQHLAATATDRGIDVSWVNPPETMTGLELQYKGSDQDVWTSLP